MADASAGDWYPDWRGCGSLSIRVNEYTALNSGRLIDVLDVRVA